MTPKPSAGADRLVPTSRRSLLRSASLLAGTSLLGTGALQAQSDWTGANSNDWDDAGNWTAGVPSGANAVVNDISTNVPLIDGDISATPVDIIVGVDGNTGQIDHTAGSASTGNNNWAFVGNNNGTGTYNLADVNSAGGTFTGFGQGSGSLFVGGATTEGGGRLYIGSDDNAGGTGGVGVVNVNTSGVLSLNNDLFVGGRTGNGTLNLDNGAVSSGDAVAGAWTFIGANSSTGTFNMSGGSYTMWGRLNIADGGTSQGTLNISGGTFTKNNDAQSFRVGNGGTAQGAVNQSGGTVETLGGELWVGQGGATGTYTMSAGNLNVGNWIAVGRENGTGTFTQTGGTVTKTGGGSVTFGTIGNGNGTGNISGGLFDIQSGLLYVGEGGDGSGTVTLSGTGQINVSEVSVGAGGTVVGTFNLDGGTLQTGSLHGGTSTSNVSFNGTQINATGDSATFITGLTSATVNSGGLLVNDGGFAVGSDQAFTGSGGLTKSGGGTLTLAGVSDFTGATMVSAGTLFVSGQLGDTDATVSGGASLIVGDGASYNMMVGALGDNTSIGGTGTLTLDGALSFDLSGAAIVDGNSWQIVDNAALNESYGATFSVSGFSESADVWTRVDGTNSWTFEESTGTLSLEVIPEPSIALLGSLGVLGLLRRRRH